MLLTAVVQPVYVIYYIWTRMIFVANKSYISFDFRLTMIQW